MSRRSLNHCAAAPFIVAPPVLPSLSRCRCLHRRAAAAFLVAPLLPLLSRCRSLHCCAAAPFIVMPPVLPSSLRRRGLCCRALAPFLVALPVLPLSSRCRCLCHCAAAGSAFVIAPPLVLHSSSRRRCLAIGWWQINLRRNSLHTDGWTDDSYTGLEEPFFQLCCMLCQFFITTGKKKF